MIDVQNISKSYRTNDGWNLVLDNVSMTIPTDKSIGILGLNGSGKSTLLRLIGGVEEPDSGTIYKDVKLSWPIGFSGGFAPLMTGREATKFIARIYGENIRKMEIYVKQFSELGDYYDMPIESYSSGMRARLAFATSMAIDFDCYLVDEITAVGDARFKSKYQQEFKRRSNRSTVVMVSHQVKTIEEFCEITAILHDGKITIYNSVEDGIKAYEDTIDSIREGVRMKIRKDNEKRKRKNKSNETN